jgi:hypothetical protein
MVLLIFSLEFIFMIVLNEGELITLKLNDLNHGKVNPTIALQSKAWSQMNYLSILIMQFFLIWCQASPFLM